MKDVVRDLKGRFVKGSKNPVNFNGLLGKKWTEERKAERRLLWKKIEKKAPPPRYGENSHLYKHGLSNNPEYLSWIKNKRNRLRYKIIAHTFEDWENLKKKFNYTCLSCGKVEPEIKLSEDHIIPLSLGGDDKINNIQPLCHSCNSRKHNRTINYIKENS